MTIHQREAAGSLRHAERTFYFCSRHCIDRFRAEPQRYLAQHGARTAELRRARAGPNLYTCPMHPQIRQTQPGACPQCGMALEPLEPASEENPELRDMSRRFWISALFAIPVVLIA